VVSEEWVCATTSGNRHHAELAKITLEAAGIEVHLSIDDASGVAPHFALFTGGAKVMVRAEDLPKAVEILKDLLDEKSTAKNQTENAAIASGGFLTRIRQWLLGK